MRWNVVFFHAIFWCNDGIGFAFLKIDNKLKMRIPPVEFMFTPSKFHYSLFQCDATSVETCNTGDPKDITHELLAQALTPKWKRHQRGRRSVTSNNNDTIDNYHINLRLNSALSYQRFSRCIPIDSSQNSDRLEDVLCGLAPNQLLTITMPSAHRRNCSFFERQS